MSGSSKSTGDARRPGVPYTVGIRWPEWGGSSYELRITEERLRAVTSVLRASRYAPPEIEIGLDEIRVVRPRATRIDIVCFRGARHVVFEFQPFYADRERLLWELALRVPDAVERGIEERARERGDDEVPSHELARTPAPATPGPALPPTGPRREGASPPPGDPQALSGLDDAMEGLGSSLVASRSTTPAPPRSGLGCGLFAAEPEDDDRDDEKKR